MSMRSIITAIAFIALALPAAAQQQDSNKKLPPGYVLFPNAHGENVPIKEAKTFAQCMHNSDILGYSQAQGETYCHEHYSH
jgi:hypothetical protein